LHFGWIFIGLAAHCGPAITKPARSTTGDIRFDGLLWLWNTGCCFVFVTICDNHPALS